jgi:hypothetical protein
MTFSGKDQESKVKKINLDVLMTEKYPVHAEVVSTVYDGNTSKAAQRL